MSAFAIPSSLDIDFRAADWLGAAGNSSWTVGDVTAVAMLPAGNALLSQSGTDGLGIDSNDPYEDPHEVGPYEMLQVNFTGTAGDQLTGVWVTKLFVEGPGGLLTDVGYVELWNGATMLDRIGFWGEKTSAQNPLGDVFVDFLGAFNLTSAKFYGLEVAPVLNLDYAVAGFEKSSQGPPSVPDSGASFALLAMALCGLCGLRRRLRG